MSSDRFLTFQVCDDIRMEVGNKFSLIGCYPGNPIYVNPIPSAFPKLCVVASAYTPPDRPFSKLVLRIAKDDKPVAELPIDPEALKSAAVARDGVHRFAAVGMIIMSPFPVEAPMKLRVEADTEDGVLLGGHIWIEQPPPSSVPQS